MEDKVGKGRGVSAIPFSSMAMTCYFVDQSRKDIPLPIP